MPATRKTSAETQDEAQLVAVVPYKQAAVAVLPTIAAQIVPVGATASMTMIVTQYPAMLPWVIVLLIFAAIGAFMLGLSVAARRFVSVDA